jgi:nucleoid DNA-binding protein
MTKPTTKEELANRISVKWDKITQKECLQYIDSMPSRIEAVIKSKGGPASF